MSEARVDECPSTSYWTAQNEHDEKAGGAMTTAVPKVPAWLGLNVAALTASLAHVFVDTHLGLFGASSPIMSALQAGNILLICLVMACWSLSLATAQSGTRPGLSGAFTLAIGWALLGNGTAFVAAPPPSPAFPYQDITHFSSLIFGGLAAYTTSRELKQPGVAISWRFIGMAVVLMLASFILQAMLAQSNG